MRSASPVNDDAPTLSADAPMSRCESGREVPDDRPPEPRVDADERTLDEPGYGYGV